MRSDERAVPVPRTTGRSDEAEAELRATCRRQTAMIEALLRAVGDLRSGASALKAENADLRADRRRRHRGEAEVAFASASMEGIHVEAQVSLGVNAPAMARRIVADALHERVASSVIERARQTISELVTNSVCHGASPDGGYAVVRLHLTDKSLLLEVEDPGHGGAVVRRRGNLRTGGGFGLHLVETLSERWGSERRASGAMRVWAELAVTPKAAGEDTARLQPVTDPREEVHVVPEPRAGTWKVCLDVRDAVLSRHDSETAAEAAARAQAALHRCQRIIVHDRYFRTRAMSIHAPIDA